LAPILAESDIAYLPMAHGFMYLAAILDVRGDAEVRTP
jgi:hypothetical protein